MIKKVTILSDKMEEVEIELSNFYLFGAKIDFEDIRHVTGQDFVVCLSFQGNKKSELLVNMLKHFDKTQGCRFCEKSEVGLLYRAALDSWLLAKLTLTSKQEDEEIERRRQARTRVESLEL